MAEYIEREALLKVVSGWRILVKDLYDCGYDDCITAIEDTVSDAPAADVEPVRRGKWLENEYRHYCSECGHMGLFNGFGFKLESNYCPHCGAKMGGEENGK